MPPANPERGVGTPCDLWVMALNHSDCGSGRSLRCVISGHPFYSQCHSMWPSNLYMMSQSLAHIHDLILMTCQIKEWQTINCSIGKKTRNRRNTLFCLFICIFVFYHFFFSSILVYLIDFFFICCCAVVMFAVLCPGVCAIGAYNLHVLFSYYQCPNIRAMEEVIPEIVCFFSLLL